MVGVDDGRRATCGRRADAGVDVDEPGPGHDGTVQPDAVPEILVGHVDVDAFFASVEQRDKPSLRGRPVVVGGVGPRGVVATASYEARAFGVHSAMPMAEARRRCPSAAILAGRFQAYRASSDEIMAVLRRLAEVVEPVSLDEAYIAIPAADVGGHVERVRCEIRAATQLSASVGVGRTKLVAKIASDDAKPDGVRLVIQDEQAYLDPLPIRRLPGLGPQTEARLHRLGISTVRQLRSLDLTELTGLLGQAHGGLLSRLARAQDDRPVLSEHEVKSVSVEETFDTDVSDPATVEATVSRMAAQVGARLRAGGVSGRTVTVKARYPDFTTLSRSATRPGPTDDGRTIARMAAALLSELDMSAGVRLLGVGCSGLTPWVQDDLFDPPNDDDTARPVAASGDDRDAARPRDRGGWTPGQDVTHDEHGPGWVWGSGAGLVTVRFETRHSAPGPVRTFRFDDPCLRASDPEPLDP